jgi:hypothetical protein
MFGLTNLKLIAIAIGLAVAVGAVAYPAWKLGGAHEQADADKKVAAAKATYEQMLLKQTQLTDHYRDLADGKYDALMKKLGNIKVVHTTVTNNITKERADNPALYNQKFSTQELKSWDSARSLFLQQPSQPLVAPTPAPLATPK